MATPNLQPLEVSLSPSNPELLVISDTRGGQSTISAERFQEMTDHGMKVEDIYFELVKADNALDKIGVDAARRESIENLYGTRAMAINTRDGNYLITCVGANGAMLNGFTIPQADYVSLRAEGVSNGQIYGAIIDGKIPATQLEHDPEDENLELPLPEPNREKEEKLNERISNVSISGNLLTMSVDGKEQQRPLSPKELADYAQGITPLSNLANDVLVRMDIMAAASKNFEQNMDGSKELLTMSR